MNRARVVAAALVVSAVGGGAGVAAQSTPEGWVVLPVEEYRALRERANPPAPPPPSPPVDRQLHGARVRRQRARSAIDG
jgi:hypothetical protein